MKRGGSAAAALGAMRQTGRLLKRKGWRQVTVVWGGRRRQAPAAKHQPMRLKREGPRCGGGEGAALAGLWDEGGKAGAPRAPPRCCGKRKQDEGVAGGALMI